MFGTAVAGIVSGCATLERTAQTIEQNACDPDPLNQLARHTARVQGFEATDGKYLVVGFCEGEADFNEAKLRWLDPYTGQDADLKLYLYNRDICRAPAGALQISSGKRIR